MILIFGMLLCILVGVILFFKKQKSQQEINKRDQELAVFYEQSQFFGFSGQEDQPISLVCLDVKLFLWFTRIFFLLLTLPFLGMILVELDHENKESPARIFLHTLEDGVSYFALFLLVGGLSIFFLRVFSRVEEGRLKIRNKPLDTTSFQIVEPFSQTQIIYLKNYKDQWILLPMTWEELRSSRYHSMNKEVNQIQLLEKRKTLKALAVYLSNRGARVEKFQTISSTLIFWGGLWLVMMISALVMLRINHN